MKRGIQTRPRTTLRHFFGVVKTLNVPVQERQFRDFPLQNRGLPPPIGAEIAFAGRSNAGKSSAINTLTDHNRLAFVSKTPGRTQLINFFPGCSVAQHSSIYRLRYAEVPEKVRLGGKPCSSVLSADTGKS